MPLFDDVMKSGPTTSSGPARRGDREIERSGVLDRALDPADTAVAVVAWPGRRLTRPLLAGDIAVSQPPGLATRSFILTSNAGRDGRARIVDVAAVADGDAGPARIIRLHGPDQLLRDDLTVVRASLAGSESHEAEFAETPPRPPAVTRPTLRSGARGAAVIDAQQRLNRIDQRQAASQNSRIERCPLTVDGIFGPNTRSATISFQKLAFPGQFNEWDGVIGPKTWAQLDAWSFDQPIDPPYPVPPDIPPIGPIIPVVDIPLDPPRWRGILQPVLSPDSQLRVGNAVRGLIDGREAFEEMESDINGATGAGDFVYLLGWDMVTDFDVVPKNPANGVFPRACPIGGKESGGGRTIIDALQRASDRGAQVRVMLWAKPPLEGAAAVLRINLMKNGAAIRDDETAHKTGASTARLQAALAAALVSPVMIPVIIGLVRPDLVRMFGAHHQKVLVVKRSDTLVAYCGGVDFNANRLYAIKSKDGDPQHDTHCRIVGPSAWDLLDTFIRRWKHHPSSAAIDSKQGRLRGDGMAVPQPLKNISPVDGMGLGPCSVIVARTFNPVHGSARTERDIQRLLLRAIGSAKRFIYFEDQYLFDYPDAKFPMTLDMASALNAAVPNIQHLTILLPHNGLAVPVLDGHYRKAFIDRVLFKLSDDDKRKVGVYEFSHSQEASVVGCHDYVHSKCWVFDDELAVIGSANCNRRGYQHDSEVDAFIFDDPAPDPSALTALAFREDNEAAPGRPTFAQFFRARLWGEHLRMPPSSLTDGVGSVAFWRKAARPPGARVIDFDITAVSSMVTPAQAEALREFVDPVP